VAIQLLVEIIGDASKLSGALDDATAKTTGFGGSIGSTVTSMLPMAAAAAGVAVAIAGMTQAAAEDRAEQDKLVLAYQNATGSTQDYTAAIDAAIESGAAKAFSDTEIRDALTGLITATGDAAAANAALGPTLDIARAAGVSAEVAADAYSKALAGNDAALRKLFPGMEKQASAADTITEATKLSAGAADEYAKSAEGMAKIGGDAFGELGEEVGGAFLPIMDALIPALVPFIQLLGQIIKAILPPLTVAINVVVAALKIMISVLSTIVDWISKLIGWLNDAIGAIGRFLDSINPLKGISLPSLPFGLAATGGTGGAAMARSGRSGPGAGGGGVTVNVYGGDPHAIERAVARGFRGWTGISGRTAGTREF
jgi:Arc/MetJ-type ribon-helix-helix transcriptional regulator